MKVKLIKDHEIYGKADETVEVDNARANYLHRMGVINLDAKEPANDLVANIEILASVVKPEEKELLIDEAKEKGVQVKEDKTKVTTKEEKITKETK